MRQVAFVRAVMVGREGLHREVLLRTFREAGAIDVRSHLATGNVSFDLSDGDLAGFSEQVDADLSAVVGRDIEVFIRSLVSLSEVDAGAIFATAPFDEIRDRLVTFFHAVPELPWPLPRSVLKDHVVLLTVRGTELYSVTQTLNGEYRAPGGLLERVTGQRATSRAWSTIEKILKHQPH